MLAGAGIGVDVSATAWIVHPAIAIAPTGVVRSTVAFTPGIGAGRLGLRIEAVSNIEREGNECERNPDGSNTCRPNISLRHLIPLKTAKPSWSCYLGSKMAMSLLNGANQATKQPYRTGYYLGGMLSERALWRARPLSLELPHPPQQALAALRLLQLRQLQRRDERQGLLLRHRPLARALHQAVEAGLNIGRNFTDLDGDRRDLDLCPRSPAARQCRCQKSTRDQAQAPFQQNR